MVNFMQIRTQHIINSLPLVADVLGRKYGVQVEIGGPTASTNGRTIHIPALPLDAGLDTVRLARGYIDHESGHLRHSDFNLLRKAKPTPFEHYVWNVLEDYCVESKLASAFPGCRDNLAWLRKYVQAMAGQPDFSQNPAMQILYWLDLHVSARHIDDFAQNRDEAAHRIDLDFPGLRPQLEPVIEGVTAKSSTRDCLMAARKLSGLIASYTPPKAEPEKKKDGPPPGPEAGPPQGEKGGPGVPPTEGENSPESPTEAPSDPGQNPVTEPQPESHEENDQQTGGGYEDGDDGDDEDGGEVDVARIAELCENIKRLLSASGQDLPKSLGESVKESLEDQANGAFNGLEIATEERVKAQPLQADEAFRVKQSSIALSTRLNGLLQGTVLVRSRSASTGSVDYRNIAKLSINDYRVFLQRGERHGLNTAVHILLDNSGSMSGPPIKLACQACFALASALSAMNGVTVAVTAFPGTYGKTVAPLLRPKERLHDKFSVIATGNTPLAEALWWVIRGMATQVEERKIILVVTDGEPDSDVLAKNALEAAHSQGLEVLGIGINTLSIQRLLPEGCARTINALPELAPAMFGMLEKAMLRRGEA